MNIEDLTTINQVIAFLEGTQRVAFEVADDKDSRYRWVQRTLVKFHYLSLSRPDKGVLIRYLMKISGYSRQQITRLIKQYRDTGRLVRQQRTVNGFSRRFTAADIRLLAAMDERHSTPNGLTMKKLCERAYTMYGQAEYQRLASFATAAMSRRPDPEAPVSVSDANPGPTANPAISALIRSTRATGTGRRGSITSMQSMR